MASAVMIFVALASSTLLIAGLTAQAVQQNQTDLQGDTVGVLSRLADELSEANVACVRTYSSPPGIVFASARDAIGRFTYDSSAFLQWQGYVCYYVDNVNGVPSLIRKWSPLARAVPSPPGVPPAMTTAWFKTQALPSLVIGRHIGSFTLTGQNPRQLAVTATNSGMGRADSLTVSTQVFLRN